MSADAIATEQVLDAFLYALRVEQSSADAAPVATAVAGGCSSNPGLGLRIDAGEAKRNIEHVEELGGELYHPNDGSIADW